ncbi:hypothetical protein RFM98_20840 [Mesorhizobium sp. VK9D]|uniref:hypothetical protein n=1 Tax=Mesorhizobium australafricanum TaxID=3072311 RepID=UPI002A23E082|nr:hypothetical protein [Mesorhizobium sp. VK9D]MDX8455203.1 hypothetical protein [Mesorhizobium sp. VK9D]
MLLSPRLERQACRCAVAEPAQLAILAKALNDYCAKHRISDEHEREQIALMIMGLFGRGIDPDRITAELEKVG